MLSLGSTPVTAPSGPTASAISPASSPGPDADVHDPLARAQAQQREQLPALLDDVGREVGGLDAPRGLLVELEDPRTAHRYSDLQRMLPMILPRLRPQCAAASSTAGERGCARARAATRVPAAQ